MNSFMASRKEGCRMRKFDRVLSPVVLSLPVALLLGGCVTYNKPFQGPPSCCPGPVVAAPKPKRQLTLKGVNFDFDKSQIRPDAQAILDEDIRILQGHPGVHVLCEGHTDAKGTNSYNERLAMRRAVAVRNYLVSKGIAASATTVEGRGELQPVASNDTDDGRAENRRVELRLLSGSLDDEG
jgi:OOP family OmpA-OmpF porin